MVTEPEEAPPTPKQLLLSAKNVRGELTLNILPSQLPTAIESAEKEEHVAVTYEVNSTAKGDIEIGDACPPVYLLK